METFAESTPVISLQEAVQLSKDLFGLETTEDHCKQLVGYDDKNFYMKGQRITNDNELLPIGEFVLKVVNGMDSKDDQLSDATVGMIHFLAKRGIRCPTAVASVNGKFTEVVHLPFHHDPDKPQSSHAVRLYRYVPGSPLCSIKTPNALDLNYDVGRYTGNVSTELKDYYHVALEKRSLVWDLKNVLEVKKYEYLVKDRKEDLTRNVFERIEREFTSSLKNCPLSVIHGDINEQNVLVEKDENGRYYVSGLIDYGDINYSHRVFDPAIATAYMAIHFYPNHGPLETSGYLLAGFQSTCPLSLEELSLVPIAMAGRIITSLLLGLHSYTINPANDYTLITQKNGWSVLEALMSASEQEISQIWKRIFALKEVEWPKE